MTRLQIKAYLCSMAHRKKNGLDDIDIPYLKDIYSQARDRYKPRDIKVLIIVEAPPCALDRFFYFEDVKTQDSLFLEIMGILYPRDKELYLKSKRDTILKEQLLERFRADGFWLLDLYELPTDYIHIRDVDPAQDLIRRIDKTVTGHPDMILIKANVYDLCYSKLFSAGYHVIDERIPFPGSGQQGVFRERFRRALQQCRL